MATLWRAAAAMLVAFVACVAPAGSASSEADSKVYQVRAALMLNIARFTTYPDGAGSNAFTIGIVGDDPFGAVIDAVLKGKDKDGAAFEIKRLGAAGAVTPDVLKGCQIVFVPGADTAAAGDLRSKVAGSPVLIIGETDDALKKGAMASLPIVGGKPNIQIHITRVREHGLEMAAKLLQAADVTE